MQDLGGQDELPTPHGDDLRSRSPSTDVDPLALYLSQISRYPLLSAADEIAIGYAIRDSRDKLDLLRLQRLRGGGDGPLRVAQRRHGGHGGPRRPLGGWKCAAPAGPPMP